MSCQEINLALNYLKNNGYSIKEEVKGWTKMDLVIYMDKKLTVDSREHLKSISGLGYHRVDSDPHYAKEELFVCHKCKIAISFAL